jgi:5-methylcytosine-specific restriction endonuclease McrA
VSKSTCSAGDGVPSGHKRCNACGTIRPLGEFTAAATKDGLRGQCRSCEADYKRRWRARNIVRIRAARKARYYAERTENIVRVQEWAGAHAEERAEYRRNHYAANAEAYKRKAQEYRVRKTGAFVAQVSRRAIYARDRGLCGICGLPVQFSEMHLDHVIPLCQGGTHEPSNVQVSHPACNLKKGRRLDPFTATLVQG